jgi:hypothetical protein
MLDAWSACLVPTTVVAWVVFLVQCTSEHEGDEGEEEEEEVDEEEEEEQEEEEGHGMRLMN